MSEPRDGERVTWGDQGARPLPPPPPLPKHSTKSDDCMGAGHRRHREMKGLAAWITVALGWHDT